MISDSTNNSNISTYHFPKGLPNFDTLFDNSISILGLTLHFEELLIISLAFLLLTQENCDFLLVIALLSIL